MNGSGGDLVGIQASRMTTYLNKQTNSLLGTLPENDDRVCQTPCSTFFGDISLCRKCGGGGHQPHGMPARVLLLLLFPGHILFVLIIFFVKLGTPPTFLFFLFYLIAAFLQVTQLLFFPCYKSSLVLGCYSALPCPVPGLLDVEAWNRPR